MVHGGELVDVVLVSLQRAVSWDVIRGKARESGKIVS